MIYIPYIIPWYISSLMFVNQPIGQHRRPQHPPVSRSTTAWVWTPVTRLGFPARGELRSPWPTEHDGYWLVHRLMPLVGITVFGWWFDTNRGRMSVNIIPFGDQFNHQCYQFYIILLVLHHNSDCILLLWTLTINDWCGRLSTIPHRTATRVNAKGISISIINHYHIHTPSQTMIQ